MSHQAQRNFVSLAAQCLPQFFQGCRVLEVGSLNINGTVRQHFSECEYIGLDVAPGRDVDVVCQGQDYADPDNTFDQVISCEAMEHNPYWIETFKNMLRVCRPGGLVLITCATTGRREHGTSRTRPADSPLTVNLTWDYYRNLTKNDFARSCDLDESFSMHRFWVNWSSYDLYFCGIKKETILSERNSVTWRSLCAAVDQYVNGLNKRKVCRYRALIAQLLGDKWFARMRVLSEGLEYLHDSA